MTLLKQLITQADDELEEIFAQYINQHPQDFLHATIQDITSQLYISNHTIYRLLEKVGYLSFTEFKYALKKECETNTSIKHKETNQIIEDTIQSIHDLALDINLENYVKLANIIKKSKTVYIHGIGNNQPISRYLYNNLLTLDIPSVLINEKHYFKHLVSNIKKDELVIIYSQSSPDKDYLKPLKTFNKLENIVILFTNTNNQTQSKKLATYTLETHDIPLSIENMDANTRIDGFLLTQFLIEVISANI